MAGTGPLSTASGVPFFSFQVLNIFLFLPLIFFVLGATDETERKV